MLYLEITIFTFVGDFECLYCAIPPKALFCVSFARIVLGFHSFEHKSSSGAVPLIKL
jgi:hypothetical protein